MDDAVVEDGQKKRGCGQAILIVGAVLIGVIFLSALFGETPEEQEAREKTEAAEMQAQAQSKLAGAEKMTAGQLFNAYQSNEVAAQQALAGKSILISGTIDDITLDFMDEPVVSLVTSNQFMSVQLDFDEADAAMVGGLQAGQEFTALCDKVSEVAGTPMLDDCVVPEASAE